MAAKRLEHQLVARDPERAFVVLAFVEVAQSYVGSLDEFLAWLESAKVVAVWRRVVALDEKVGVKVRGQRRDVCFVAAVGAAAEAVSRAYLFELASGSDTSLLKRLNTCLFASLSSLRSSLSAPVAGAESAAAYLGGLAGCETL